MSTCIAAQALFLAEYPLVSVVIPCRNEHGHILKAVESVLTNGYDRKYLEVIVVDGLSDDGTRDVLRPLEQQGLIRVIDNPRRSIPCALNAGIDAAQGEIIVRLDAHSAFAPGYLAGCVQALHDYPAAARVGGPIHTLPQAETGMGRAIATVLSSPFGVGASRFRLATKSPIWVDTVPFWAVRRAVLHDTGEYDERLTRSEDISHSLRMCSLGYRTLLVPGLTTTYYARSGWSSFASHAFLNGEWAILPFRYVKSMPVGIRHLVPLLFVTATILLLPATIASTVARWLAAALLVPYAAATLYVGVSGALKRSDIGLVVLAPIAMATLHFSYGLGSLWALVTLTKKWRS